MLRTIISCFFLMSFFGCSSSVPPSALGALFSHQDLNFGNICVEVLKEEPKADLLVAARAFNPEVHPLSFCHQARVGFKTNDGQQARIIRIKNIEQLSPKRIVVTAELDFGISDSLNLSEYTLEKVEGSWVLTGRNLKYRS